MKNNILIFGTTQGIGLELKKKFEYQNDNVISINRQDIDLACLKSVKNIINIIPKNVVYNYVILNAGVGSFHNKPNTTNDGYEYIFQVNYLSYTLITKILCENFNIKHIIILSSPASNNKKLIYKYIKIYSKYSKFQSYAMSKLYLDLWGEYIRKTYNIPVSSIKPGIIDTKLWNGVALYNFHIRKIIKNITYYYYKITKKLDTAEQCAQSIMDYLNTNDSTFLDGRIYEINNPNENTFLTTNYEYDEYKKLWNWTLDEINNKKKIYIPNKNIYYISTDTILDLFVFFIICMIYIIYKKYKNY